MLDIQPLSLVASRLQLHSLVLLGFYAVTRVNCTYSSRGTTNNRITRRLHQEEPESFHRCNLTDLLFNDAAVNLSFEECYHRLATPFFGSFMPAEEAHATSIPLTPTDQAREDIKLLTPGLEKTLLDVETCLGND